MADALSLEAATARVAGLRRIPWAAQGRDRLGLDCWGLVRLAYAEIFRIDLPSYAGAYEDPPETAERAALVSGEAALWWRPVEVPQFGDVGLAWLTRPSLPVHVGLFVAPGFWLHVDRPGSVSSVARYDDAFWRTRVVGWFRHRDV